MSLRRPAAVLPSVVLVLALAACSTNAKEADEGKASPLGLVVLILFLVAVVLLVRSMTKHLKRVPDSFEPPPELSAPEDATDGTDATDAEPEPSGGDAPDSSSEDQRSP